MFQGTHKGILKKAMKYCRRCESGFDMDGHLNLYVVDFLSNYLCKKNGKHKRAVVVFIPDCAGIAERFPTVMTERTRRGTGKDCLQPECVLCYP